MLIYVNDVSKCKYLCWVNIQKDTFAITNYKLAIKRIKEKHDSFFIKNNDLSKKYLKEIESNPFNKDGVILVFNGDTPFEEIKKEIDNYISLYEII